MANKKLRECPFCGEDCAEMVVNQGNKWAHYEAGCLEVRTGYIMSEDATWRDEAVRAWNTRSTDSIIEAKEAEVKRLRLVLEDILYRENERVEYELKKQINGMPLVDVTIQRIIRSALKRKGGI